MELLNKLYDVRSNVDNINGDLPSNKEIYKRTIGIAWPSALECVLVAMIGAIDTIMVGSLGKEAISAVGICTQPKYFCLSLMFAINTATVVMVARRKGQGKQNEAIEYSKIGIIYMSITITVVALLCYLFAKEIIVFAGANDDYLKDAIEYYKIIVLSLIPYAIGMCITSAHRGAGFTKISMVTNLSANLVNIIFNAFLINGLCGFPRLEVKGAAIATAIGNCVSFIVALISYFTKKNYIHFNSESIHEFKNKSRNMLLVAKNTFGEQIILRFGFFMFAKIVATLGTVEFAAHQAVQNIMTITFSFGDGLQTANTSLVGQSLGAKRDDLAQMYTSATIKIGRTIAILLLVIISINARTLVGFFTSNLEVIETGIIPMYFLSFLVIFQIPQAILFGALRGAGDLKFIFRVMFISVTIIRTLVPYVLAIGLKMGLIGAWIGTLCDQVTRYSLCITRFKSNKWKGINL